jgi:hypothetical protein
VENFDFFNRISRLRDFLLAGKHLYAACTEVGQKTSGVPPGAFFTSHPVDIHQLVHSQACFYDRPDRPAMSVAWIGRHKRRQG